MPKTARLLNAIVLLSLRTWTFDCDQIHGGYFSWGDYWKVTRDESSFSRKGNFFFCKAMQRVTVLLFTSVATFTFHSLKTAPYSFTSNSCAQPVHCTKMSARTCFLIRFPFSLSLFIGQVNPLHYRNVLSLPILLNYNSTRRYIPWIIRLPHFHLLMVQRNCSSHVQLS